MNASELSARQKTILLSLVGTHIRSGNPIGSKTLLGDFGFPFSSATIRNEMVKLEELGYLVQPHKSAGRVPSAEAYRHFVENLIFSSDVGRGSSSEENEVADYLLNLNEEFDDLLDKTSKLLARLTNYVSLVMAPVYERSDLKRFDIIRISDHVALVIVITSLGHVIKENMVFTQILSEEALRECEQIINKYFGARSYLYIVNNHQQIMRELEDHTREEVSSIIGIIIKGLIRSDGFKVYFNGAANIALQSEIDKAEKIKKIYTYLEEGNNILGAIKELPNTVEVMFGFDSPDLREDDLSFVLGSYKCKGERLGMIGLMGPQRMDYERAISLVRVTTDSITKKLEIMS